LTVATLRTIKALHTSVWAIIASSILAIPIFAWRGQFRPVVILTIVVLVEVVILLANGWRCPLTDVAARYTDDRSDNFDIFLPLFIARYNKLIFGSLFAAALLLALLLWLWQ